jgi:hypothetical protein
MVCNKRVGKKKEKKEDEFQLFDRHVQHQATDECHEQNFYTASSDLKNRLDYIMNENICLAFFIPERNCSVIIITPLKIFYI